MQRGWPGGITQRLNALILPRNLGVHLRLVIVIPRERGIYLGKRKVRMVLLNRLGIPAVTEVVERDFDDLDVGVVNPRASRFIEANVRLRFTAAVGARFWF